MDKYFKESNNILLQNDSMVVLNDMIEKKMTVDLVVTDPPYKTTSRGNAGNSGGMLQKKINKKGQVFKHNSIKIEDWLPKVYTVLKETGHCYIMTNNKNLYYYLDVINNFNKIKKKNKESELKFIKSLIWDKGNKIMGQYYMSQFEYILFLRKGKAVKINNCGTSDLLSVSNKKTKDVNKKNLHDTEKPVELMKILIENSSQENEIVFDPFMGIGTTGIACDSLSRRFIGIELDENYYDIAVKRINNNNIKESGNIEL